MSKPLTTPTFTPEEIDDLKAVLYLTNSSNHCANPAPLSWIRGYNAAQVRLMGKRKTKR